MNKRQTAAERQRLRKAAAERLVMARIKAGYVDQKAFYSKFDLPQPTYSMQESGKRGITPQVAKEYAAHLGNCTAAWLMYGEGDGPDARTNTAEERRYKEIAAFVLLYDRVATLANENDETLRREFGLMFSHYGYDEGPRGIAQMAFQFWREIAEEGGDIDLPERAIKKIEWLNAAFDALKESVRKMKRLFEGPTDTEG